MNDVYLPHEAEILERIQESPTIFTLRLRFTDAALQKAYRFLPGQFNMVYLYGIGEVAISIVSDPNRYDEFSHTIRTVGRVTQALANLSAGQPIGIRGPFGHGWPLELAKKKDVIVLTGGLGCAPVVSAINYMIERREQYGNIKILQGVKHSNDFIFYQRYQQWLYTPNTQVLIAADQADANWPWQIGRIVDAVATLELNPENTIALLCGPEIMMHTGAQTLLQKNVSENNIYLSMERNMECAIGHCGHCQFGGLFVCKNGPIFPYVAIKDLLLVKGF